MLNSFPLFRALQPDRQPNMLCRSGSSQARKRSDMLRLIMPYLSGQAGDKLAEAVATSNQQEFVSLWREAEKSILADMKG